MAVPNNDGLEFLTDNIGQDGDVGACGFLGILIPSHFKGIVEIVNELVISVLVEAVYKSDFHVGLIGLCINGINFLVICAWRVHSCLLQFFKPGMGGWSPRLMLQCTIMTCRFVMDSMYELHDIVVCW